MVAVELCSGAGGLARGFVTAGIEIAVAIERNKYAASTYRFNFPKVDLIEEDLASISGKSILQKLNMRAGDLDVLVAGLPCQGFSESNRRTRTAGNPNNILYREMLKFLADMKPKWFVIENVAGIRTLKSGRFLKTMLGEFHDAGYRTQDGVLNAADFGVPQSRRRTFLVGTQTANEFSFPQGKDKHPVTVRDAIADLPLLVNGARIDRLPYGTYRRNTSQYAKALRPEGVDSVTGNEVSRNTKRVVERYGYISMGENWRAIPVNLMENYANLDLCHTGIYYRLRWDEQAKVIGNFRKNMLIHPVQDRGLSIREAARLQSFDDRHEFVGPLNDRQQQVGDAVPPRLAEVVGSALVKSSKGC